MKKKRFLTIVLIALLIFTMIFTGCSNKISNESISNTEKHTTKDVSVDAESTHIPENSPLIDSEPQLSENYSNNSLHDEVLMTPEDVDFVKAVKNKPVSEILTYKKLPTLKTTMGELFATDRFYRSEWILLDNSVRVSVQSRGGIAIKVKIRYNRK